MTRPPNRRGEPARVYHAGEFWIEHPGAHHIAGENASETRAARLLAVFVVDTEDTALTPPTNAEGR